MQQNFKTWWKDRGKETVSLYLQMQRVRAQNSVALEEVPLCSSDLSRVSYNLFCVLSLPTINFNCHQRQQSLLLPSHSRNKELTH
jgi:hypothetical protein